MMRSGKRSVAIRILLLAAVLLCVGGCQGKPKTMAERFVSDWVVREEEIETIYYEDYTGQELPANETLYAYYMEMLTSLALDGPDWQSAEVPEIRIGEGGMSLILRFSDGSRLSFGINGAKSSVSCYLFGEDGQLVCREDGSPRGWYLER